MNRNILSAAFAIILLAACSPSGQEGGTVAVTGSASEEPTSTSTSTSTSTTPSTSNSVTAGTLQAVTPGSNRDFLANVGDRVFFGFNSSGLNEQAQQNLLLQAAWLNAYPSISIVIQGHADERGTREYNLALGERRASAVREFLVNQGIDSARIDVISYGKERPEVAGSNEAAWAQNRRGVTVITSGANS